MTETHVVTCFLRAGTDILLLLRSEDARSYAGRWGAVSGYVEGDPDSDAYREIREETGFKNVDMVRGGHPFEVRDEALGKHWMVHPYLFDAPRRAPDLNWESSAHEWVEPSEILRRNVVPELWTSYRQIAPTLDSIRNDKDHGSAYLSLRAVEVLRDRATELAYAIAADAGTDRVDAPPSSCGDIADSTNREELRSLAKALLATRPAMTAVCNRVNRVMYEASQRGAAMDVEKAAANVLRRAIRADDDAGAKAATLIEGKRVLTLSRSGTVTTALEKARPDVIVAHSIPGGEGRAVAEYLASIGLHVSMCSDAGISAACDQADLVLVGADTILADGSVVNKVGTRAAALSARARSIPVYVTAAADKISPKNDIELEQADGQTLYDGDRAISLIHPLFEITPPDLVTAIITERDVVEPQQVATLAEEFARLATWHDRSPQTP